MSLSVFLFLKKSWNNCLFLPSIGDMMSFHRFRVCYGMIRCDPKFALDYELSSLPMFGITI